MVSYGYGAGAGAVTLRSVSDGELWLWSWGWFAILYRERASGAVRSVVIIQIVIHATFVPIIFFKVAPDASVPCERFG